MYEITIKEIKTETKRVRGEWTVIENAPDYEKEVESTTEILSQRVETLDLPAVIKAINNLT